MPEEPIARAVVTNPNTGAEDSAVRCAIPSNAVSGRHPLTQASEVLGIPGIEDLNVSLQGAARDQRIVCRATRNSICGCALEDREVFSLVECDQCQALANVIQEEQGLVRT